MKNMYKNLDEGMYKIEVSNTMKGKNDLVKEKVFEDVVIGQKNLFSTLKTSVEDYLRDNGEITIKQISGSKKNFEGYTPIVIAGMNGIDSALYRERVINVISSLCSPDVFVGEDADPLSTKVDLNDREYISEIAIDYNNFVKFVKENKPSKVDEYNLALTILNCYNKSGQPLTVKIGNRNEGTPTQVLYNLVSEICNSYNITDMIKSVLLDESGNIREELKYGFKFNEKGNVRPSYSDNFIREFTTLRFKELGIDDKFVFNSGKTIVRDDLDSFREKRRNARRAKKQEKESGKQENKLENMINNAVKDFLKDREIRMNGKII